MRTRRAGLALALAFVLLLACGRDEPIEPVEGERAATAGSAADFEQDEADRLMALGYVEVVEGDQGDEPAGATVLDAARMQPGLNFYVNAHLCSAELITAEGEVLERWSHEPCLKWGNAVLLPSGGIVVIHRSPGDSASESLRARSLLRLDADGTLLWSAPLPVHHDVDVMPDGRIAVLTYRHTNLPDVDMQVDVREHFLAVLDAEGRLQEEVSLVETLQRSDTFRFRSIRRRQHEGEEEVDLIHSNSVEWMHDPELAEQHPIYALNNVLICSRNQNSVIVIDWETKQVVWSWGQQDLSGPHDATLLANGNILIFDNGLGRKRSRVVEVDPRTDEIVWSYQGKEGETFFSSHRGSAQRLANGNTLITVSADGRAFEVTPEGDRVWTFVNPNRSEKGERVVIVRTRRVQTVPGEDGGPPRYERSD